MMALAMWAAMKGPMYSLRENGIQHGSHGFHLRLSTFQDSKILCTTKCIPNGEPADM